MYSSTSYSRHTAGDVLVSRVATDLETLTVTDIMVDHARHLGDRLAVTPELHVVRVVSVQNLTPEDAQAPRVAPHGLSWSCEPISPWTASASGPETQSSCWGRRRAPPASS